VRISFGFVLIFACVLAGCGGTHATTAADAPVDIKPALRTDPVPNDPDDPSIWIHPSDPARSLIIGTNKVKAPDGALVVFGLDGKTKQTVSGLDRPNNVDVEYGLPLESETIDIAVAAERLKGQLRIFRIAPDGSGISDITSAGNTRVFTDRTGEQSAPMGIALYKRPSDSAIFAIVAPKEGPREGYLAQYRLQHDGQGQVKATFIRYFGRFSGSGEIEAVAVDNELGYVYYADEGDGIHKYHADPAHPQAAVELAHFGQTGFRGDREGIGIYARPDGTGYIICTDQLPGNSEYRVFLREGELGRPHDHSRVIKVVRGGADSTDGLEVTSRPIGPSFPNGLMIVMNSKDRNFLVFRWEDIAAAVSDSAPSVPPR
jgi:3-phytase